MADTLGDTNDIIVMSQSADHSHSTTMNRPPNSTTTTTVSQTNHVTLARTQMDADKGVNEVEEMRKQLMKDV